MRTRLLRSLARAKPAQSFGASNAARVTVMQPTVMYKAQLQTTIYNLHASFGGTGSKRSPRFIHGAHDVGTATTSDPTVAKVDAWGLSDPQIFLQFAERFPGDAQYGLGPGETVGVPNPMDVSQPFGMLYGEGFPGGMAYFRATEEMRGRFLTFSSALSDPPLGIPKISSAAESITAVWLAKSTALPAISDGTVGMMCGSSVGVVTAYSLGPLSNNNSNRDHRFDRGQMTARWVLCPGIPIISIAADNEYSSARYTQNRIWVVVLNALGEVFYLTKFPSRKQVEAGNHPKEEFIERNAWLTGRTVYWSLLERSRRVAKPDPYANPSVDGSYSPRTSWTGMCLSPEQVARETREIEEFASRKPIAFQKACIGWDMRRRLEVDFAGDDGNFAGENIIVFNCGIEENSTASVKRYSRRRFRERTFADGLSTPPLTTGSTEPPSPPSLFGAPTPSMSPQFSARPLERLEDSLDVADVGATSTPRSMTEEWRCTQFAFGGMKLVQISSTTVDGSFHATQTWAEDPLSGFSGKSSVSSPTLTPRSFTGAAADPVEIPGHRARLFAAGTTMGTIFIWDMRAPVARSGDLTNTIEPVRVIHTTSPEISCLAMSSLYLVHGGNDGLVQTWDPLGSSLLPIRTLHSKASSRARRDISRANLTPQGVGINLYAAGAICLDPDPTVLRGVVSLGNQLRYWSYSSSAADQYKSSKRRLRYGQRGSNAGAGRFTGAVRSNLKDYIADERLEMDREKRQLRKESERFAGRFGTNLLDGSEEEMLAYAALLSQESLEQEQMRRMSDTSFTTSTVVSSNEHIAWPVVDRSPLQSPSPSLSAAKSDEELDADIAEAIRQSLATSPNSRVFDIPIRHAKPKNRKGSSARTSPRPSPTLAGASTAAEMTDLEFAIQLSLAEEQSKTNTFAENSPVLPASHGQYGGKGKGRVG